MRVKRRENYFPAFSLDLICAVTPLVNMQRRGKLLREMKF